MKQGDIIRIINEIAEGMTRRVAHERVTRLRMQSPSKYSFSRNWYQAHFDSQYYFEVDAWCEQQFGAHPRHPDAWSRWWHKFEDSILFRDKEDYMMFVLRWGRHD